MKFSRALPHITTAPWFNENFCIKEIIWEFSNELCIELLKFFFICSLYPSNQYLHLFIISICSLSPSVHYLYLFIISICSFSPSLHYLHLYIIISICSLPPSVQYFHLFLYICSPPSIPLPLFPSLSSPPFVPHHLFLSICSPSSAHLNLFPPSVYLHLFHLVPVSVTISMSVSFLLLNKSAARAGLYSSVPNIYH